MNGMLMCGSDQYLGYAAHIKQHRAKETESVGIASQAGFFLLRRMQSEALYEESASTDQLGTTLWPVAKL